jgi:tetratricopeptide (TPR) repeat protein
VALYTGLGELHRLRGELDWAERYLSRGTDIRYQAILPATTYRLYTLRARMHESRHNYQNALADLDTAERLFAPGAVPDVFQIGPLKARIWLRLGRHREALEWAENHPIGTTEGPVPYRDIFSRLTWIRVMVEHAMETRDDAGMTTLLSVLDNFVEGLLPVGFTTMTIEALLLQSSILDRHGEVEAAAVSVERAVELSEPESIIQPFLDEGMVLFRPLKHALSRGKQTVFLKTVLTALQGDGSKESPPAAAANHLLIEPLSPQGTGGSPPCGVWTDQSGDRRFALHISQHSEEAPQQPLRKDVCKKPHGVAPPGPGTGPHLSRHCDSPAPRREIIIFYTLK